MDEVAGHRNWLGHQVHIYADQLSKSDQAQINVHKAKLSQTKCIYAASGTKVLSLCIFVLHSICTFEMLNCEDNKNGAYKRVSTHTCYLSFLVRYRII